MTRHAFAALIGLIALNTDARAQTPTGFHWVNFKQEPEIVDRIAKTLRAETYTAIREIGLVADSALVFTTERDPESSTPKGDMWTVYTISIRAGKFHKLLIGYDLRMVTWLKFRQGDDGELGITYLDCFECEPTTLFTALHYEPKAGWKARWPNKEAGQFPGVLFMSSDAGAPYSDYDVDQVWAVLASPSGLASIGTWCRSRDLKTNIVSSTATKYSISPLGEEKSTTLIGSAATLWERELCAATDAIPGLLGGQDTKSCKRLLRQNAAAKR